MKKHYFILLFLGTLTTLHSQTITNIRATQDNKDIIVTYDLTSNNKSQTYNIQLFVSIDGNTEGPLQQVSGDVGGDISSGQNKRIRWQVLEERERLQGDNIQFKVIVTYTDRNPFEPYSIFVDPAMIFVQGGTFQMGSNNSEAEDNEKPVHSVTLSDFSIGKYEVTNAQFCKFLNEKGNKLEGGVEWVDLKGSFGKEKCRIQAIGSGFEVEEGYENFPVLYVSWYGARAFCNWLKEKTGKNYQLPTEAQWEYAARGGNKSRDYKYAGSNNLNSVGWSFDNSSKQTHEVGQKKPNELGIYDMTGNVWEWCQDLYGGYSSNVRNDPTGPASGSFRVIRGGSWSLSVGGCRVTSRSNTFPEYRLFTQGFRVIHL